MKTIRVQITKFISDDQPGIVECRFNDAFGNEHIVQEKVPIVTDKYLDANSEYPQEGVIACEIVKEVKNKNSKSIFTVDTSKPWYVEAIDGQIRFDLLKEQLTEFEQ